MKRGMRKEEKNGKERGKNEVEEENGEDLV